MHLTNFLSYRWIALPQADRGSAYIVSGPFSSSCGHEHIRGRGQATWSPPARFISSAAIVHPRLCRDVLQPQLNLLSPHRQSLWRINSIYPATSLSREMEQNNLLHCGGERRATNIKEDFFPIICNKPLITI